MRSLVRSATGYVLGLTILIPAALAQVASPMPGSPPEPIPGVPPTPPRAGALVTPSPTPRADLPVEAAPGTADSEKAAAPNEHHERLTKLVGKWVITLSTMPYGQEPAEWKGTVEYSSIMGGRFITEHAIMDLGGMLMEWQGIYGYDNDLKKYTAVWVDNMSTDIENGEGEANAAGTVLTIAGQAREPGGRIKPFTWIITLPEGDHATIEMRDPAAPGEPKTMMKMELQREKKEG